MKLEFNVSDISFDCVVFKMSSCRAYMGIAILPSCEKECVCRTSSRSRELSLSDEGIVDMCDDFWTQ